MSRKIPKPHFTNHRHLLGSWKAFCNCWGKCKISFLTTLPIFSHTFSLLLFFPELEEWLCFFSSLPPSFSLPHSTFKQPYPYGRTDKSSTTLPPHKLQNSSHSWVLWFGAAETGNTFQLNPKQCSHDPLGTGLWGAQVQTVSLFFIDFSKKKTELKINISMWVEFQALLYDASLFLLCIPTLWSV